jgi:tetratricopeptide (TPR) repeat protein
VIGLLALLAMLSKEVGFLLPVVVLGVVLGERPHRRRTVRLCLPIAAATVIAVLYRLVAIASIDEAIRRIPAVDPTSGLPLLPVILRSVAGMAVELGVLVFPLRLSYDYSWLLIMRGIPLYLLAGISVVVVIGAYLLAHRRGEGFPRTALVLLALLPLLLPALIPDRVGTFASERHLYLALPGWIGLLLLLGRRLGRGKQGVLPALVVLAAAMILLLGIRTALRVGDFKDQDTLLQVAQKSHPQNPQVLVELGNRKLARADYKGAIELYKKALDLDPYHPIALVNLAQAYIVQEEWGLALRALDHAALPAKHVRALRMVDAKAHYAAGRVLLEQERNKEAALALERVLLFYPEHLGALGNLGLIYVKAPHYVDRGMKYLNYVLERETDPVRRAVLQKALEGAHERMEWYLNEYGVPLSEREPPSEGAIGEPWKEVAAEGM